MASFEIYKINGKLHEKYFSTKSIKEFYEVSLSLHNNYELPKGVFWHLQIDKVRTTIDIIKKMYDEKCGDDNRRSYIKNHPYSKKRRPEKVETIH